jgi:hypothetical protein
MNDAAMPRYVILRHDPSSPADCPAHWDLMLENEGVLATWALSSPPVPGVDMWVDRLADHRAHYLDYEGPVSRDRGTVRRWDAGEYRLDCQTPDAWQVTLCGAQLQGHLTLEADAADSRRWRLRFSPDQIQDQIQTL